jgi:hypothetical protein
MVNTPPCHITATTDPSLLKLQHDGRKSRNLTLKTHDTLKSPDSAASFTRQSFQVLSLDVEQNSSATGFPAKYDTSFR